VNLNVKACKYRQLFRKSKWKSCYDWRSVGQSVLVSSTHLGIMAICITLRGLRVRWCMTTYLTGGPDYGFCRTDTPRCKSRGENCHILLWKIWNSFKLEGHVPGFLSPQEYWEFRCTPRHWVLFTSGPSTRRDTVQDFESASTRINFVTFGVTTVEYSTRWRTLKRIPCSIGTITPGNEARKPGNNFWIVSNSRNQVFLHQEKKTFRQPCSWVIFIVDGPVIFFKSLQIVNVLVFSSAN
jgi:hypothetical protein